MPFKGSSTPPDLPLNHPHCAKFYVLGGASCIGGMIDDGVPASPKVVG